MDLASFKTTFDGILQTYVQEKIDQSRQLISDKKINKFIDYINTFIFSGGKRIRPFWLRITYTWFGGDNEKAILNFGIIFELLSEVRADSSEYVRKSVGNNLKDLSKYVPEQVLIHGESWIKQAKIEVKENLASQSKSELGDFNFYLVWTLKQALRWLQEKEPRFHPWLERILGKNYVLYFHEKKNWSAKPKLS